MDGTGCAWIIGIACIVLGLLVAGYGIAGATGLGMIILTLGVLVFLATIILTGE